MHSTEGIKCVKVFLFLQISLVEVQCFGLHLLGVWKRDHHVVDDVVVLGEGGWVTYTRQLQALLAVDDGVVSHVVHLGVDVLLLISRPQTLYFITTSTLGIMLSILYILKRKLWVE